MVILCNLFAIDYPVKSTNNNFPCIFEARHTIVRFQFDLISKFNGYEFQSGLRFIAQDTWKTNGTDLEKSAMSVRLGVALDMRISRTLQRVTHLIMLYYMLEARLSVQLHLLTSICSSIFNDSYKVVE